MIKEYAKQVMHNVIAHHLLTNAQSVPEQWLPSPGQFPLFFLFKVMSYGVGCPFGQLGSADLAVSPPSFPCTPSLLTGRAV